MAVLQQPSTLAIIQSEHRAIAAVVHALDHVLTEVRERKLEPPFEMYAAVIAYMRDFPDRFHHPKEDDHLFKALKARDPSVRGVIDELQRQHADGRRMIADLQWKLDAYRDDPEGGFTDFDEAAVRLVAAQRSHIELEEGTVIPAARRSLGPQDWEAIDRAFADNDDPLFGANPKAAYDRLFSRIVAAAPEPWGLARRGDPPMAEGLDRDEAEQSAFRRRVLSLNWI